MIEGVVILAVLIVIIIIMPKDSRDRTITSPRANLSYGSEVSGTTLRSAPQARYVSLGAGNAAYAYQPYEEYITIENRGESSVNITNWQLKNGKDKRPYYLGGTLQRFSADIALIPQATRRLSPYGNNLFGDVILERGERAIVTTGSVGVQSPYRIVSFKENSCSGYLEKLSDYAFTPPLTQNCPRPDREPGVENLDTECRSFISTLSSCQTPTFNVRDSQGDPCTTCVNDRFLNSSCVAFIKEHFNYGSCIAYHGNDADFSGRTWRIFLGRGWEMWAKEYETIELWNQLGQLVDFQNY